MSTDIFKLNVSGKVLLIETVGVTIATICLIKLIPRDSNIRGGWFFVPFVFITAALLPTFLRKRSFAGIGLRIGPPAIILRVLFTTSVIVFPLLFAGIFLLRHFEIQPPLGPIIPKERWISWLFYQFMYIAVAEEVFFRGYFQSNVQSLLAMFVQKRPILGEIAGIIISAAIFAISHCLILGSLMPIITFLPGLIFGWLFVKTKSLLAPILFHGLANVVYGWLILRGSVD